MLQSILSNLAVILLSHLIISSLISNKDRIPDIPRRVFVLFLLLFTVVSMFYLPIYIGEYRFDLRLIPLIMTALFSGWSNTLVVLAAASLWRLAMGGDGAVPGVLFGMMIPTLFTLVYAHLKQGRGNIGEKALLITACWLLSDIPVWMYLSEETDVLKEILPLRYVSFLVAALIYYILINLETSRVQMKDRLEFLASHDQLTELLTKQECLRRADEKRKSTQESLFFSMIDIDHFKKLNDRFGHVAGDQVLIQMAGIFKSFSSDKILVSRYGGEEFMIFIEAADRKRAMETLGDIQQRIRSSVFRAHQEEFMKVTVSIGLAQWKSDMPAEEAIKEADRHLYMAKELGRDRLVHEDFVEIEESEVCVVLS